MLMFRLDIHARNKLTNKTTNKQNHHKPENLYLVRKLSSNFNSNLTFRLKIVSLFNSNIIYISLH